MFIIADIMSHPVKAIGMDHSLAEVKQFFEESGHHHVVVLNSGTVVGVISDRDLLRQLSPYLGTFGQSEKDTACLKRRAHQIMSRHLVVATPDLTLEQAAELLLSNGISCLPVIDKRRHCIGIVTWRDILKVMISAQGISGLAAA